MITLVQIGTAINKRLIAVLPNIAINTKDIIDGFVRPSLTVDFDNTIPSKFGTQGFERTISVTVYFFPTSLTKYKFEILEVQQLLELSFVENLEIIEGFVVFPSELASTKVDGILQFSFDIQLIEIKEEITDGSDGIELMDELDVNF